MSDLRAALRPGDILNTHGFKLEWKKFFESAAVGIVLNIIKATQRKVFGQVIKKGPYDDTHTMMYFDPEHIMSVTIPCPEWAKLAKYEAPGSSDTVSVYRMNPAYFGRALKDSDVALLQKAATEIVNAHKSYDVGQLIDILINSMAGYPYKDKRKWFEKGKKHLVCSVGVATVIASWRHALKKTTGEDIPQPWKTLNPKAWAPKFLKDYPHHWDIDEMFPANYAVTETHFKGEFLLVGRFKNGKKI